MKQVASVSHIILKEGICVGPSKLQDVLSWNALASVDNMHSFLGFLGYY
jgi:hypothetical protein